MSEMPTPPDLPADLAAALKFDSNGLVAAIAQQHDTGEILMLAWMNREAIAETLRTGRVCYWSRSRGKLWRKGETSGQAQHLKALRIDCDGDALLVLVEQPGVACHTGRRSCFYREVAPEGLRTIQDVVIPPEQLYGH
jgi:phosphoribosyl-AMP cyclohydrolase